jgi:site-specific recombinase XerD
MPGIAARRARLPRLAQAALPDRGRSRRRPDARHYAPRHSFASLLLHEGRIGIVALASQLGHNRTMTLNTYGHVIAELRGS